MKNSLIRSSSNNFFCASSIFFVSHSPRIFFFILFFNKILFSISLFPSFPSNGIYSSLISPIFTHFSVLFVFSEWILFKMKLFSNRLWNGNIFVRYSFFLSRHRFYIYSGCLTAFSLLSLCFFLGKTFISLFCFLCFFFGHITGIWGSVMVFLFCHFGSENGNKEVIDWWHRLCAGLRHAKVILLFFVKEPIGM